MEKKADLGSFLFFMQKPLRRKYFLKTIDTVSLCAYNIDVDTVSMFKKGERTL